MNVSEVYLYSNPYRKHTFGKYLRDNNKHKVCPIRDTQTNSHNQEGVEDASEPVLPLDQLPDPQHGVVR